MSHRAKINKSQPYQLLATQYNLDCRADRTLRDSVTSSLHTRCWGRSFRNRPNSRHVHAGNNVSEKLRYANRRNCLAGVAPIWKSRETSRYVLGASQSSAMPYVDGENPLVEELDLYHESHTPSFGKALYIVGEKGRVSARKYLHTPSAAVTLHISVPKSERLNSSPNPNCFHPTQFSCSSSSHP